MNITSATSLSQITRLSKIAVLVLLVMACARSAPDAILASPLSTSSDPAQRSTRQACNFNEDHYRGYGEWATKTNDTHSVPVLLPSMVTIRKFDMNSVRENDDSVILTGSKGCPSQMELSLSDKESLMSRALCPFYWRINFDPLRIPSVLPEAVCRCSRAITARPEDSYECHTLAMDIRVLKFNPHCNEYVEDTVTISTACVSAHQPFHVLEKHDELEQTDEVLQPVD